MGNHELHDRHSPGEGDDDRSGLTPADPASLAGFAPPPEYREPLPDLGALPWTDDGRADPPVVVDVELPDPTEETAAPTSLTGTADLGVRPYVDRPGRLYMSGTYDQESGETVPAPPGSPRGVTPDPDRPADIDEVPPLRDVPPETLLGVAASGDFTGHAGADVTDRHDPGDPEQYAGQETDDGFGDDPIEAQRAGGGER